MAFSEEFKDFVMDQLHGFDAYSRRMFGGVGIFKDGLMFALISDDALYFKVDESNKADFPGEPFNPFGRLKLQYYEVPVEVLEDSEKLLFWADKANRVAIKAKRR